MPPRIKRQLAVMLLSLSVIVAISGIIVLAYAEGPAHEEKPPVSEEAPAANLSRSIIALSAGIAVAASTAASAVALKAVASAGFAASAERPELSSYLLILGGLAEGIAIYGLLVAILLLGKI